jgi:hypothetical protein
VNALGPDLPVDDDSSRDDESDVLFIRGLLYALGIGALMWSVAIGLLV